VGSHQEREGGKDRAGREAAVSAALAAGTGIRKTARLVGTGNATVRGSRRKCSRGSQDRGGAYRQGHPATARPWRRPATVARLIARPAR